jgi:molybdopterin converting factor small subunit
MAEIRVLFKGLFRQMVGGKEKKYDLTDPTLEGLVRTLEAAHGKRFIEALRDSEKRLSPGVTVFVGKRQFAGWETPLTDGDEVTFLHFIVGG